MDPLEDSEGLLSLTIMSSDDETELAQQIAMLEVKKAVKAAEKAKAAAEDGGSTGGDCESDGLDGDH